MNPSVKDVLGALAAGRKKKHAHQKEPGKKWLFIHHHQACFLKPNYKLLPPCEGIQVAKAKAIAMLDYVRLLLRLITL